MVLLLAGALRIVLLVALLMFVRRAALGARAA